MEDGVEEFGQSHGTAAVDNPLAFEVIGTVWAAAARDARYLVPSTPNQGLIVAVARPTPRVVTAK